MVIGAPPSTNGQAQAISVPDPIEPIPQRRFET
ncbi:MAG: hypothetical protein QOF47_1693, partial [Mycobacterium sp.]|nr:hypothetical protein [Mycobacterium sp.]